MKGRLRGKTIVVLVSHGVVTFPPSRQSSYPTSVGFIGIYMWAGTIGSRRHSSFTIGFLIETAHMDVQVSDASHML